MLSKSTAARPFFRLTFRTMGFASSCGVVLSLMFRGSEFESFVIVLLGVCFQKSVIFCSASYAVCMPLVVLIVG